MSHFIGTLEKLVKTGHEQSALEVLNAFFDVFKPEALVDLVLIESRMSGLNRDFALGKMTDDDYRAERTQVNAAVWYQIQQAREVPFDESIALPLFEVINPNPIKNFDWYEQNTQAAQPSNTPTVQDVHVELPDLANLPAISETKIGFFKGFAVYSLIGLLFLLIIVWRITSCVDGCGTSDTKETVSEPSSNSDANTNHFSVLDSTKYPPPVVPDKEKEAIKAKGKEAIITKGKEAIITKEKEEANKKPKLNALLEARQKQADALKLKRDSLHEDSVRRKLIKF